jgi:hypothetical protein
MARIPISRFGLTQSANPAKNGRLLHNHLRDIDDGDVVAIGRGAVYGIEDGSVQCMRGDITIEAGADSWLEYSSEGSNKSFGPGSGLLFGYPDPALCQPGTHYIAKNITLRGVGIRDVGRRVLNTYEYGHWPSPIEFSFIENGLVEYCRFPNGFGNSGLNILGWSKNQFESWSQRFTVQYNVFGANDGRKLQGDGVNLGGYSAPIFRGNTSPGGVGRHFIELGTGIVDLLVEDNDGDLTGDGLAHLASWTASRSAIIRRNKLRNWGWRQGASAVAVLPDAPQYNIDDGSSIFTGPDGQPLPLNRIYNVVCEDNLFSASASEAWPAAIAIIGGDLRNHIYRRNTFDCMLGFYVVGQPADGFLIEDNKGTAALRSLIATQGDPIQPLSVLRNRIPSGARLFDHPEWATNPLVTGADTTIYEAA